MIRRKIWATATFCLAVAGAAQAQTGPIRYVPRGGYVAPTPPTYAAPTPNLGTAPLTAEPMPPAPPMAAMPGAPAAMPAGTLPVDDTGILFAADTVQNTPATPGNTPAAPMQPGTPPTIPVMPRVMPGTPMATPETPTGTAGVPMGTVTSGPMVVEGGAMPAGPLVNGPMISGGPIVGDYGGTPILDGTGASAKLWLTGEYMNWKVRGPHVPPLVTIGPAGSGGTLGEAGVAAVYGGTDHDSDWTSGFRLRAGLWLDNGAGIDLGGFYLSPVKSRLAFGSNGDPGIYRPFFNTATGAEDAALVAFVDPAFGPIVSGRILVNQTLDLSGADVNYRAGWNSAFGGRFDALLGFRYARLDDKLTIESDIVTQVAAGAAPAGTAITVIDKFRALNQFYGGQVGLVGEWQAGNNLTFGLRATVAGGANCQQVEINGSSVSVTPAGARVTAAGGVLALPSNIGSHDRTEFSLLSEAGATLGYQVGEHLRVFGGYNVLSWTNVARAGEQINRRVNGTFIPDPTTGTAAGVGFPAPAFHPHESSFWAHGWTAGAEWRW